MSRTSSFFFKKSLRAIVPIADELRIQWRDSTYDDWDRIADALYESIVNDAIRNARLPDGLLDKSLICPRYDLSYISYAEMAFIEPIIADVPPRCSSSLHSLCSIKQPFDAVRYVILDRESRVVEPQTRRVRIDEVDFRLCILTPNRDRFTLSELVVEL